MKFCDECKHFYWDVFPQCDRVKLEPTERKREHYCKVERSFPWFLAVIKGECGQSGRFWEAKETPDAKA